MSTPTILPRLDSLPLTSGPWDRLARQVILRLLGRLTWGRLTLVDNGQVMSFGEPAQQAELRATVTVHHPRFYRSLLVSGSRANIAAHYDLGNDFSALFLDETLTYSCGIFERADSTLKEASLAKYDRICRKLNLSPGDQVLEIGCGWGGFALHAAGRYGCRVTATTLSRAQYELARERIAAAGLGDRVTLLLKDYRQLEGTYDKLVSIEMIEAVGYEYWDTLFKVYSERLKEKGLMCLQAITMADQAFDRYRRSYDFIRSHVFPGSCLTSVAAMTASLARVTDLRLIHLEEITPHYVTTLRHWG